MQQQQQQQNIAQAGPSNSEKENGFKSVKQMKCEYEYI